MDNCSKPGCSTPATVFLAYDYSARSALLVDPDPSGVTPHLYPMCSSCADNLTPPRGWNLEDQRAKPALWAGMP